MAQHGTRRFHGELSRLGQNLQAQLCALQSVQAGSNMLQKVKQGNKLEKIERAAHAHVRRVNQDIVSQTKGVLVHLHTETRKRQNEDFLENAQQRLKIPGWNV